MSAVAEAADLSAAPAAGQGGGFGALAARAIIGAFVAVLCLGPFLLVLAISFGEKIDGEDWRWSLSLASYQRFLFGFEWPEAVSFVYPQKLWFSLYFAVLASILAVAFAFPFTWLITRQSRRAQAAWLVFILASLSLSEVFVVMGWDILLSGRSGLPMVAREIGLTDWLREAGWWPTLQAWDLANPRNLKFKTSAVATVVTMSYLVFPYAVILLYPPLSRIDPSLAEAARTMGARSFTVIRTVVLPAVRLPILGATFLLFVYLLGAYVVVTQFADPSQQTLTVTIYNSVRGATLDAPFAAAQSVALLLVSALLLLASARVAKLERGA
ncbi:MAG: ABC transporter permease [Rubrimonas sp.]|uniref:ABC transporter permease n=1 Tax=Rubrimonas sp. TaxID=2036015 RepID=UPI002FDDA46A